MRFVDNDCARQHASTVTLQSIARNITVQSLRLGLSTLIEQSPRTGPLALAVVIGFISGMAAVVFLFMIEFVDWIILDQLFGNLLAGTPT